MITLTPSDILGSTTVRGNTVIFIENPVTCRSFDWLQGKLVLVDTDLYRVVGIEAKMHAPPWHEGEHIGLMIKRASYYE